MNSRSRSVSASAPGKVIIVGEHFVVHGSYAVAASINKRVRATVSESSKNSIIVSGNRTSLISKNDGQFSAVKAVVRKSLQVYGRPEMQLRIEISSNIPAGSGLGSSAAVSVATAASLTKFLNQDIEKRTISEIALAGEKQVHGNPSGIDTESCLNGGLLLFSKNSGTKPIPLDKAIQLVVIYSGKKRRTSDLISKVSLKKRQYPAFFDNLVQSVSFLSLDIVEAMAGGDLPKLGALMSVAQASLSWIGVSNEILDEIIESACSKGAYGAKITGAGGGGSVIALPKPEAGELLLNELSKHYPESFITPIPQEGLRWED